MARIFISYAREDKEIAKELEQRLMVRKKHDVFRDVTGIPGGSRWEHELVEKAKWCHILLLLVSSDSNASGYVYKEFREAEKNNKIIFPVVINNSDIPLHLQEYNASYLKYVDDENNNLSEIILKLEDIPLRRTQSIPHAQKRKFPLISLVGLIFLVIAAIALFFIFSNNNENDGIDISPSSVANAPSSTATFATDSVTSIVTADHPELAPIQWRKT